MIVKSNYSVLSCSPVLNLLSFIPNKYAKDIDIGK